MTEEQLRADERLADSLFGRKDAAVKRWPSALREIRRLRDALEDARNMADDNYALQVFIKAVLRGEL